MVQVEEQLEELPLMDVSRQRYVRDSVAFQRSIFSILPDIFCNSANPETCEHVWCTNGAARNSPDLIPCNTCWWGYGLVSWGCERAGHVNMETIDRL